MKACMCLKGHLDVAELLLDRGADVGQANTYGVTALMAACQDGHRDVAALLLDRGADVGQANRGVDGPDVGLSGGADVEAPVQVRGSATAGEKWDFISETVVVHSSNRVPAPRKRAPSGRASRVATVTHTHRVRTHSALPNAHGRCVFSTLKRACAPLLFSFVFLTLFLTLSHDSPFPVSPPSQVHFTNTHHLTPWLKRRLRMRGSASRSRR